MQRIAFVLFSFSLASDGRRVQVPNPALESESEDQAAHPLANTDAAFVPSSLSVQSPSGKLNTATAHRADGNKLLNDVRQTPSLGSSGTNHKAKDYGAEGILAKRADVGMSSATSGLDDVDNEWRALNELLQKKGCDADLQDINTEWKALNGLLQETGRNEQSDVDLSEMRKTMANLKEQKDGAVRKAELKNLMLQMQLARATHFGMPAAPIIQTEESKSWFSRLSQRNALFLGVGNLLAGIGLACRNRATAVSEAMPAKKELKKMMPLAFMLFCILFNYTVLRDTKDVLVVTSGGAEVIPFLKTYVNLPAAIGITALYSVMVNRMSGTTVFYTLVASFAAFFGTFAAFIYPNLHLLHPTAAAASLSAALPSVFGPFITIFKYWTFGAFYTFAQLWGSVVVSLLFWGFANEVCSVSEAKRWYPLFGMLANVALIFSGQFVRHVSMLRGNLPAGVDPWGYSLKLLMAAVVTGAGLVMLTYKYMQRYVLTDPDCVPANMEKKTKKKKPKMGLGESFKYLASSSYIRNLAFLVICYGTSINIVEVTWKGKLVEAFSDPNAYSSFMGAFSSCTGAVTLCMMFLSRWVLGRFGWGKANLVTPVMLGVTGIGFFSLLLFQDAFAPITAKLGLTPLMMAVLIGAVQNIASKASKYSFFEPCKETAIIPLDSEMRTKGKAAIDVIGNPLGKSGGSFIQQLAIVLCGSLSASTPFLGVVLFGMVGLWIKASQDLAVEFEEKAAAMSDEKPAAAS